MKRLILICLSGLLTVLRAADPSAPSGDPALAARAINTLGLELLAKTGGRDNALLSPYSIQTALAMTFAGAAGSTRTEMAKVLHFTGDEPKVHASFAGLQKALDAVTQHTAERAERARQYGGPQEPFTLTVANRLFGQNGYTFRAPFLSLVKDSYRAPFQPMDFAGNPAAALEQINGWVEQQTRQRIRNLIPPNGVRQDTRMVLVNAIYLKAPWAQEFSIHATKPATFYVRGSTPRKVPTMVRWAQLGYARRDQFSIVTVPYIGAEVQLVILLPDKRDGLAALESVVTPELLASCASLTEADVSLHLPRFKIEPPTLPLGKALQELGMNSAFDQPRGSANFSRIAPPKPGDYLFISDVFHKTFLKLDEKGTEAAGATAVFMPPSGIAPNRPEPITVRIDHPFLFGIQHRRSGACLFVGRVTNPL